MDTVFIEQLAARTIVGVRDWERQVEQTLYLDLELGTDITAAGRSDAVTDAVDYAAVARFAVDQVGAMRYQLVESVAEALVRQLDHYGQHVGQIIFLAKHLRGATWRSLSIPTPRRES